MPKFTVKLRETVTYTVVVEAADGDEAQDVAADIWAQSADPTKDFDGCGEGVEPLWWEPIVWPFRILELVEADDILHAELVDGDILTAERRAGEYWNETPYAVANGDRYEVRLIDADGDCRMTIGGEEEDDLCRNCGDHYPDGGDGYNGRCPDCADKAEAEGRSDD